MKYYYQDDNRSRIGPYSWDELKQLHLIGVVRADMFVLEDGGGEPIPFKDLWARAHQSHPPVLPGPPPSGASGPGAAGESFTQKARDDLRALTPHLLVPLEELRSLRWLENRQLLSIAGIGLFPLFIIAFFGERGEITKAYWAFALYFSVWWALFFYNVFPAPRIDLQSCAICFFGTGLVSIGLLLPAYSIPPMKTFFLWTGSPHLITQMAGFLFGVGLPEELSKMAALFFILRREGPLPPQVLMFYGLMAGLGFGIYEGVGYQMGRNFFESGGVASIYYLANLIRLTTLPFLHAIWTGIAGYFIAFAWQYPQRKTGLLIVAIGLPASLHAIYDLFSVNGHSFLSLLVALAGVFALYLYLARSVDFEKMLQKRDDSLPR
jgi:RsiW-degrading membrane proteinase PrsW (M82 family)